MANTSATSSSKDATPPAPPIQAPWIKDSFPLADLKAIQSVYETLSTLPSIASGAIFSLGEASLDVQVTQSQRDLLSKAKRKSAASYAVSLDKSGAISSARRVGFPVEVSPQLIASSVGPTGLQASLRITNEKDKKKRFVEVANEGGVLERVEVTDVHGDFYADEFFGGIGWSSNSRKLAYVAEQKLPAEGMAAFEFRQTWGERYSDKKGKPTLVILDLDKKEAKALDLGAISPGQPSFPDCDNAVVFHALIEEPMRHGSIYCFNRPGGLYTCGLDGSNLAKISPEEGARCPRILRSTGELFYLSNKVTNGTHNSCARLLKIKLNGTAGSSPATVVDVVTKASDHKAFPGLFTDNLSSTCFVELGAATYLICVTMWRTQRVIVSIDVASGTVTKLGVEDGFSYSLLDIKGRYLLATKVGVTSPGRLLLGCLQDAGAGPEISWTELPIPAIPAAAQELIDSFSSKVVTYGDFVEAIVLTPKPGTARASSLSTYSKPPLIVMPHGGPNSAFATDFMLYPACLAALGFAMTLVNFTGSIGFGQESVDALVGKIGEVDIEDVHHCTVKAIEQEGVDQEAVFITGGSHGGFITAHMIAKYPKLFKSAVMRNPVINCGHMLLTSDIPSWSFEELGLEYNFNKPPVMTPEVYGKLFANSPIAGVDAVEAPVLLMLGEIDRRVPPQDGLNYLYQLKSRGREAHCLWFPENGHPLDGMDAETKGLEAMATYFLSHLPSK